MSSDFDFSRDTQFLKLLQRRSDVDLTVAALELARDAHPDLDFDLVHNWVSARADEIRPLVVRAASERESLELLAQVIADEYGIVGSPAAYESASGSFLNEVIEERQGIPISLSVLYMAVAGQLGIELAGVAAQMHFLTRLESTEGPLFLDPFAGRRILDEAETVEWLCAITQLPASQVERSLQPVEPRLIIRRMLTNLKVLYAKARDWPAAWIVQNRLVALDPSEYSERRDLAFVALKSDRPGVAVRLLNSLLNTCPPQDEEVLREHLEEAGRLVSQWN
ncbi:MAG: tetratricopeptide repeat protein [Planctomycetota bacterium]|nr:tetratricopeptide repeat protein [Planctomycetota bacterium]MDA1248041.1 tetratricopeptide repeat protein [Planctomycetota bacterium]